MVTIYISIVETGAPFHVWLSTKKTANRYGWECGSAVMEIKIKYTK